MGFFKNLKERAVTITAHPLFKGLTYFAIRHFFGGAGTIANLAFILLGYYHVAGDKTGWDVLDEAPVDELAKDVIYLVPDETVDKLGVGRLQATAAKLLEAVKTYRSYGKVTD